ncbi:MAG: sigma-70 family RNA polymerase sigma factor [Minicystis sp.]
MKNERLVGLRGREGSRPAAEAERARKPRRPARAGSAPHGEGAALYQFDGSAARFLTREQEAEIARRVEDGEHLVLRALVESPAALRELAAIGRELEEGHLQLRDVLRSGEEAEANGRREAAQHVIDALAPAEALARGEGDRGEILAELERVRLHRRVLDRAVSALRAAPADAETTRWIEAVDEGQRIADAAKSELVRANIALVMSIAKRRVGQGLGLHDLVQEGNLGLMKAADKFDHRRGLRFSTYAIWWVRQQLTRAILEQAKTIRVPVHLATTRQRVRRLARAFEQAHGRAPSEAELGAESGLVPEKVRAALAPAPEPVSFDTPAGQDDEAKLGDFVPDRVTPAPDEQIARAHMREQTRQLLGRLTPREQDVLRRRFGLDDAPEQTLAEIGASLSVSRERVRQIEAEALRKLRQPSQAGELDSYLAP